MAGLTPEDNAQIAAFRATATPEEAGKFAAELYKLRNTPSTNFLAGFPRGLVILIAVWFGVLETAEKIPMVLLSFPRYEAALAETQAKLMQPDLVRAQLDKAVSEATTAKYAAEAAPNQPALVTAQLAKATSDAITAKYAAEAAPNQPALTVAQLDRAVSDATTARFTAEAAPTQLALAAVNLAKTTSESITAKFTAEAAPLTPTQAAIQLQKTTFEAQAVAFQPKLNEVQLAKLGIDARTAVYQQTATAAASIKAAQETAMTNAALAISIPMITGLLKQYGVDIPMDKIAPMMGVIDPNARTQDLQSTLPNAGPGVAVASSAIAPKKNDYQEGVDARRRWKEWISDKSGAAIGGAQFSLNNISSNGSMANCRQYIDLVQANGCIDAYNMFGFAAKRARLSSEFKKGWEGT